MRLINTETGEFEEFFDAETIPPYVILSHTWDRNGEQTYQEVMKIQEEYRPQRSPLEQEVLLNSHSDGPEADPEVPTTLEAPSTTSSHSPLLVPQDSPRSRSIFWRRLCVLRWTRIFSIVRLGISLSHTPGPTTTSELGTPSSAEAPSNPELPNNIQTLSPPPTTLRSVWDSDSGLLEKVRKACEIARRDGYRYIWIDSCCINKDSSSELSEAINSMFNWYRGAQVCYAFLVDVPSDEDPRAEDSKFRESRWFTRGWTLQELIAPLVVVFLSQNWEFLGTKHGLADVIQDITSIDIGILTQERALSDESVADRMGWASRRETTRVEDEAYSLLGIFGITMPTLYGEGWYAFRRLQEEILQRIPDQSIFVWGYYDAQPFPLTPYNTEVRLSHTRTLLAPSPGSFSARSPERRIIQPTENSIASLKLPVEEYTHTPYGVRTQLCLLPLDAINPNFRIEVEGSNTPTSISWYLVVLRSQHVGDQRRLLSRLCYLRTDRANVNFLYLADSLQSGILTGDQFTLSLDDLARGMMNQAQLLVQAKTVYLPQPMPSTAKRHIVELSGSHETLSLRLNLPLSVLAVLRGDGYTVSDVQGPTEHDPNSFSFTLIHSKFNIHIHYRHILLHHTKFHDTDTIMVEARVWILSLGKEAPKAGTAIQLAPPYASATWVEYYPWTMSLPARSLNLNMGSGDAATLWLGLDLTAPLQYNLHVDIAPYIRTEVDPSFRSPPLKYGERVLRHPHKTLNLILRGSARRALEMKGYSINFTFHPSSGLGGVGSHSLTLSIGTGSVKFAIVIKYLHVGLDQDMLRLNKLALDSAIEMFMIVARITLESSISDDGFKTVQDGPHVVDWADWRPWKQSLGEQQVVLTTPIGESLTLHLGLDLAWSSEYYLNVDIDSPTSTSCPLRTLDLSPTWPTWSNCHTLERKYSAYLWYLAHKGISLTLPGHVTRTLQAQGYQVHFEGPVPDIGGESNNFVRHLLTLSHIQAGVTITIEYSHHLITHYPDPDSDPSTDELSRKYPLLLADPQLDLNTGSDAPTVKALALKRCQQELAFRASVHTSSSHNVQGNPQSLVPCQRDITTATVDWETTCEVGPPGEERRAWRRHFQREDITLTLPTDHQVMLRLGFYLVWYSDYCLTVEINPRMAPSLPPSRSDVSMSMPDYELDETGMEYIRQALTQSSELGVGQSVEALDGDSEPLSADASMLEGPSFWSGGPEDAGNSVAGERPRVGAVVEARRDATELVTHSATQTPTQSDAGPGRQAQGRRKTI